MTDKDSPSSRLGPSLRQAGFTLVELLISLTLLAVIVSFIPGALRIGQRVWEKDDAIERRAALSTFRRYVEQRLAEAMPVHSRDGGGLRIAFTGEADRLGFIAPAEAGPAGGGVYRFDLRMAEGVGSQPLVLTQSLHRAAGGAAGAESAGSGPAIDHRSAARLTRLAFRYFGAGKTGEAPGWHARWPRTDTLPDLVEVSLMPERSIRPERAIVAMRLKALYAHRP
jgi:general secretion pathway protein J